jgi:hypothetical protein
MGYVSGTLNGNNSPDIIHNGDIYVFLYEKEDCKNSKEPCVKGSKEGREEGKSKRGELAAKSNKESGEESEENVSGYVSGSKNESKEVRNIRNGDIYIWINKDQGKQSKERRKEGQKIRRVKSTKENKDSTKKNESREGPKKNVMGYVSGLYNENSNLGDGYNIIDGNIHVNVVDDGDRGQN